jgi:poly-gamma-glutamate synthesis protein (capsule biosynthesis protein)
MNILIAGDFCPQSRVKELLDESRYGEVLGKVRKITERADFSILNFECPVTIDGELPIEKKGPNLQCSEKGVEAVKWAGFQGVTLANNHLLDFGTAGVRNTLDSCKMHGIATVGGGMNIEEASQILYIKIGEKTLSIINCCEHEFSIATKTAAGANPLDPLQQYYAIKEARSKADYVVIIVHGGHEHWQLPSIRMQNTYRFFIDAGADAVVNHHQHCFSGYETYKEKPIFYGLGNFCFDNPCTTSGIWNEGFMVQLQFENSIDFQIYPYLQCDKEPSVQLLEPSSYGSRIKELNRIIADPELLQKYQNDYYREDERKYTQLFEPLDNRLINALRRRGLIPSLISKKRRIMALDFIQCESHRDRLIYHLLHSSNKQF